jgi:cation diffusion facilitator CzcD-associated flavoprotein CzcO
MGPRVVIVGAGIGGVLMGIKLRERGFRDFVILEKAQTLGGTWRDNRYPGLACDVPAHLYVYSFAPNPAWKRRYAKGPEIWRYFNKVARRYGVLPHIRFGQEAASAEFDGAAWRVRTKGGEVYEADIVVGAAGRLHHPKLPDIPGAESFAGLAFHSARWDDKARLDGRRLGVIGTGSTAVQLVSAVADEVAELKLFQRTPQWVLPVEDTPIPWWKRLAFRIWPASARAYHKQLERETDVRVAAILDNGEARAARDQICFDALNAVRDPELKAKLTPNYAVGCKRMVISGTFYGAVQKPSVHVVTEGIDHIEPKGVVTADGKLHELDVLVYATGFDAHAYIRPMQVTGEDGVTLDEVWRDLPLTYRSVAIPHMPNFFLINGPYSPGGSASVCSIIETHVAYLMQLVERIVERDVLITAREDVAKAWLEDVREKASKSIWATGGCKSWYLDKTGVPAYDPVTLPQLRASLAEPDLADYVERPRPAQTPALAAA